MSIEKMTQREKKRIHRAYCFLGLCLITHIVNAQLAVPISFQYKEPRNGRPESATYFLGDFALRTKVPSTDCYYAMGSYRFRVAKTGVIDSVAFTGNMYDELIKSGEKRIRESQVYWVCVDCETNGGHWFTIPVYVAYSTGADCPANELYKQSLLFWYTLFKPVGAEQIQVSYHEWLLAPMYAVTMR